MNQPVLRIAAGLMLGIGLCGTASAADYAGDWVVKAGGRTLLVLHLEPGSGAGRWRGELVKPKNIAWYPGGSEVAVPDPQIVHEPLTSAIEQGDVLTVRADDTEGSAEIFDISLINADHASMALPGKSLPSFSLLRALAGEQTATDWQAHHTYRVDETRPLNSRMAQIFDADQAVRHVENPNPQAMMTADQARRAETAELLQRGQLHTAIDFWRAAFIFQHGAARKTIC